jgi:hypothetical protein
MAWEWVAPVATAASGCAGVFFTWLSGAQGRKQVQEMTRREEQRATLERIVLERRNAYLAALQLARVDLQRKKYERTGEDKKVAEVERKWPKAERIRMSIEVRIGIEAFGSPAAQALASQWAEAYESDNEERAKIVYETILAVVRRELGTSLIDVDSSFEDTAI